MNPGWHYADAHTSRQRAGVGDQSNACANGTEGCPGPNADVGALPCPACFLDDLEENEVRRVA